MVRLGRWLPVALAAGVVAGCASLPHANQVERARTHIQTLRFDEPEGGLISAYAELVVFNPGQVKTKVEGVTAKLCRGETILGEARSTASHKIPALESQTVKLHFEHMSVAALEGAIGRSLSKPEIASFVIDGEIIYATQEGPLQHKFDKFPIQTVLGPEGS